MKTAARDWLRLVEPAPAPDVQLEQLGADLVAVGRVYLERARGWSERGDPPAFVAAMIDLRAALAAGDDGVAITGAIARMVRFSAPVGETLALKVHVLEGAERRRQRQVVARKAAKRRKAEAAAVAAYFASVLPQFHSTPNAKYLAADATARHFGFTSHHHVNRLRRQARYWAQRTVDFSLE